MAEELYDVVVAGIGPAGMSAAIFAVRYGLKTIAIGKSLGKAADAYRIENIPGMKSVSGAEFAQKMMEHVKFVGGDLEFEEIENIEKKGDEFITKTKGKEFRSKTVIIASGSAQRQLGIKGEKEFTGKGVSYCATCDAALFKDKEVYVIGGGDAAAATAVLVSSFCKKVHLAHRGKALRAEPFWIRQIEESNKIDVIFNSEIKEIKGKTLMEKIVLEKDGKESEFPADGVFIQIGADPVVDFIEKLDVKLDAMKRIEVDSFQKTNVDGVFAAGDVTNNSNGWEQIIVAEAEGSIAANAAYNYLK